MIRSTVGFDIAVALVILIGVGLIARPALVAAHRRRRLRVTPTVAPPSPDLAAAWTVDRALKALQASAIRSRIMLPGIVSVVVDGESVRAMLASPTLYPPAPWTATPDGTEWHARHETLESTVVEPGTANPLPGLVTLGVLSEGRMLVDLERASGLIALQGDAQDRGDVTRRLIREVTTNPWSSETNVLLVGLDGFDLPITPGTITPRTDTDGTIEEIIAGIAGGTRGIAFLRDAPLGQRCSDLVEALATDGCHWSVVVTGAARYARWRFTAERDGRITSDVFPEVVWASPAVTTVRQAEPATAEAPEAPAVVAA